MTVPSDLATRGSANDALRSTAHRYERDTIEFARVVNLADAVFAIALTLLVLTLETLDLVSLLTFGVAFFLVASVWWQHHRIVGQIAWLEPGLVAINLALLAAVALVPFPTSLVSATPSSRSAVLTFVAVFTVLSLLCLVLILRADRLGAWTTPLPGRLARWVRADWLANLGVHLACLAVAVWAPVAALVLLAVGSTVTGLVAGRLGPPERRAWF